MVEEEEENSEFETKSKPRSSGLPDWLMKFHRDLMAGEVMGGVVNTIVALIERAKLLLYTHDSNVANIAGPRQRFKGMVDCIVRTIREEGILAITPSSRCEVQEYEASLSHQIS